MSLMCGCISSGNRSQPVAVLQPNAPTHIVNTNQNPATGIAPVSFQSPPTGPIKPLTDTTDTLPERLSPQAKSVPEPNAAGVPSPSEIPNNQTNAHSGTQNNQLSDHDDPFIGQSELSAEQLINAVQARNPSLQAMVAAWRAAAERYPQEISLDDPMFNYMLGTEGLGPDGGWMVMGAQKIPWFGKRQLRGNIAQAEANAACQDVANVRLKLAEMAANTLYDYYLVRQEKQINAAQMELMKEFRSIAMSRYEANQVSQQDILQADLELADLEARQAELVREENVAIARINTLLHRAADHPLPLSTKLNPPGNLPPVDVMRETALHQRPDLSAQAARIRAEEAAVNLACKEYYPDFEIVGKYDAFMPEMMRPQLGMNVNIPLWQQKRSAAWREAMNRLQQRRAEYADMADQARYEVQSTYAELVENEQIVHLYDEKILTVAKQYAQSARANYSAGKVDFLRLIDAERQLYGQWEKYYQVLANYYRRLAAMERVIGGYTF
jgi:outer membrane protein, heavy metal efflux system